MKQELKNSGHLLLTALLRVLIFVIIAVILFALGLMVGYAVLGEGTTRLIFSQKKYGTRFSTLLTNKQID